MRIRTVIVDDEPLARESIRLRLKGAADIEIVGEAADGPSALKTIQDLKPDLVFLDIRIPGFSGLEVVRRVHSEVPAVVFVTAYNEYAVKAFETCAVDYLLKPISGKRFQQTLRRVRLRLAKDSVVQLTSRNEGKVLRSDRGAASDPASGNSEDVAAAAPVMRLVVRDRDRLLILKADEMDWIDSAANYVQLHSQGRVFMLRTTMHELEEKLDPRLFARIHRTTIVRIDCVHEILSSDYGDCTVVLRDNTRLRLSRTYRENLLLRLSPGHMAARLTSRHE